MERRPLVLSGILLGVGFVALMVVSAFHPGGVDPNDHPDVFAEYARGSGWTLDHLGFFIATAISILGLVVLFHALDRSLGGSALTARIGVMAAGVAVALTAMRFAVDGVVLERAIDAWTGASGAEKPIRFASAETVRWMEEALVSYQSYVLAATILLLAVLVVWTALLPRWFGYLLAIGGVAYLAVGWVLGASGFAPGGAAPTYVTQIAQLVWSICLFVIAWRVPSSTARRADPVLPPAARSAAS